MITEVEIFEIVRKHDAYLTTSRQMAKEIILLFNKENQRILLMEELISLWNKYHKRAPEIIWIENKIKLL
jgi:hypothetical protein